MKKKLLVTGCGGFVAGSVIAQARTGWEVHGVGRGDPPPDTEGVTYHRVDLLEVEKVRELFLEIGPQAVVHAAALANIDYCEKNKNIAEKINVGITENLSRLCTIHRSKMIFCSTDNVFDGEKGFYSEEALPNPINYYGETKLRAEEIVRSTGTNWVVARLALVVGLPVIGQGNSYLSGVMERLAKGEREKAPENEIRTPIDIVTVGKALIELGENDVDGILHLSGNSRLTRYDMAVIIAERLNLSSEFVVPTHSGTIGGRAPRPEDVSLNNERARRLLKTPMLSFRDGLNATLSFRADATVE